MAGLLLLVLPACSAGLTRVIRPPEGELSVAAIVITPPRLTGTEPSDWRSFELGQRQIAVGLKAYGERFAFYGPAQARVLRWEEPGWLGFNAGPLLLANATRVEQALAIRATAEKRVASSLQEREDAQGKKKGGVASEETTWLVTVELIHPSSRLVLGEFGAQVTIDPFAPPTGEEEFDPAPALTHLLEKLTLEALDHAKRWAVERPAIRELPLTLALSPALTASQPGAAAEQTDPLQAEVWMQMRARYLSPWLADEQLAQVSRTPPGLLVVAGPAEAGVQPGDVILSVDGAPPLPEVLARKRLTGVPVQVRVGKGGAERDALIP